MPWLAATLFFLCVWLSSATSAYGIFIDELYYVSCARRLALGYVDHPPLSILLLRAALTVSDALMWLRLWPALFGGAAVFMAVRLTLRLGGSRRALLLTALASASAPVMLIMCGFYSMNAIEIALVMLLVSIALEIVLQERPVLWLAFGAVAGLGLLNKHTSGAYAAAIIVGLASSPWRRLLVSRWLVMGGVVALTVFSPNLVWEFQHDWVSLEFYRNATVLKNVPTSPLGVLFNQVLTANPCTLPLWAAGLWFGLRVERRLQFLVVAYLLLLALLAASGSSRPDRIGALYPALFAAGALQLDRLDARLPLVAAALVTLGMLVLAPASLPLLAPAAVGRYAEALGVLPKVERRAGSAVPQWFADRIAWDEVGRAVARAQASLSPEERAHTAALGENYAYASALERFGSGGVTVIGRHNSWYEWGYPEPPPTTLLLVGFPEADAREYCGELSVGARFTRPFTTDVDKPIFICRKLRAPLDHAWPRLRMLI